MRAGKLRHVLTVQRSTETIDAMGTPVTTWADLITLRAEIIERGTVESIGNQGAVEQDGITFRTWNRDAITTVDRIMFNGAALNIREITPTADPRERSMEIRTATIKGAVS